MNSSSNLATHITSKARLNQFGEYSNRSVMSAAYFINFTNKNAIINLIQTGYNSFAKIHLYFFIYSSK